MECLNISDLKEVPCPSSRFVVPTRVTFKQNNVTRTCDYIKSHDAVAVLIYNTSKKAFIVVKQFRPSVFMQLNSDMNNEEKCVVTEEQSVKVSLPFDRGVTYELCAGIVDYQKPLVEIAKSEVLEETGFDVPLENIEKIFEYCGTDLNGSRIVIYYAEVTDEMKTAQGGGLQELGEFIDVCEIPMAEAKDFIFNDEPSKPTSLISAFLWFFMNKETS